MEQKIFENTNKEILIRIPKNIASLLKSSDNNKNKREKEIEKRIFSDRKSILVESLPSQQNHIDHQKKTTTTKINHNSGFNNKNINNNKTATTTTSISTKFKSEVTPAKIKSKSPAMKDLNEKSTNDIDSQQSVTRKRGRPRKTPLIISPSIDTQINNNSENNIEIATNETTAVTMVSMLNDGNNLMDLNGEEIFYENIDDNACISVVEIIDDSQVSEENSLIKELELEENTKINCNKNEQNNSELHLSGESKMDYDTSSPDILQLSTSITRTYQNRRKSKLLESPLTTPPASTTNTRPSSVLSSIDLIEQNNDNLSESLNECRRSQRKKVMKYDVKDLFKKRNHNYSRKSDHNQITLSPDKAKIMLSTSDTTGSGNCGDGGSDYNEQSSLTFSDISSNNFRINNSTDSPHIFPGFSSPASNVSNEISITTQSDAVETPPIRVPKKVSEIFKKVKPGKKTTEGGSKRGRKKKIHTTATVATAAPPTTEESSSNALNSSTKNDEIASEPQTVVVNELITDKSEVSTSVQNENNSNCNGRSLSSSSPSNVDSRLRKLRNSKTKTIICNNEIPSTTIELDRKSIETINLDNSSSSSSLSLNNNSVLEKRNKQTSPSISSESQNKVEETNENNVNDIPLLSSRKDIKSLPNNITLPSTINVTPRGRGRPKKILKIVEEEQQQQKQLQSNQNLANVSDLIVNKNTSSKKINEQSVVGNLCKDDDTDDIFKTTYKNDEKLDTIDSVAEELKDIENFIEKGESLLRGDDDIKINEQRHKKHEEFEEKKLNRLHFEKNKEKNEKSDNNTELTKSISDSIVIIDKDESGNESKQNESSITQIPSSLRKRRETDSAISLDNSTEFETEYSEYSSLSGVKSSDDEIDNVRKKEKKQENQLNDNFYDELRKYVNAQLEEKSQDGNNVKGNQSTVTIKKDDDVEGGKIKRNVQNAKVKGNQTTDDDDEEILISFSSDIFSKEFNASENNVVIEEIKKVKKTKSNKNTQAKNLNISATGKKEISQKLNLSDGTKKIKSKVDRKFLKKSNSEDSSTRSSSSSSSNTSSIENQSEKKLKIKREDLTSSEMSDGKSRNHEASKADKSSILKFDGKVDTKNQKLLKNENEDKVKIKNKKDCSSPSERRITDSSLRNKEEVKMKIKREDSITSEENYAMVSRGNKDEMKIRRFDDYKEKKNLLKFHKTKSRDDEDAYERKPIYKPHKNKFKYIESDERRNHSSKDENKLKKFSKDKEVKNSPKPDSRDHSFERHEKPEKSDVSKTKNKLETSISSYDKYKRRHSDVVNEKLSKDKKVASFSPLLFDSSERIKESHHDNALSRSMIDTSSVNKVKNNFLEDVIAKDVANLIETDALAEKIKMKKGGKDEKKEIKKEIEEISPAAVEEKTNSKSKENINEVPLNEANTPETVEIKGEDKNEICTASNSVEVKLENDNQIHQVETLKTEEPLATPKLENLNTSTYQPIDDLKLDAIKNETEETKESTLDAKENAASQGTNKIFEKSDTQINSEFKENEITSSFSNEKSYEPANSLEIDQKCVEEKFSSQNDENDSEDKNLLSTLQTNTTDIDNDKEILKSIMKKEKKQKDTKKKIDTELKKQIKKLENAYAKKNKKAAITSDDSIECNTEIKSSMFQSKAALKDYSYIQNNMPSVSETSDSSPNSKDLSIYYSESLSVENLSPKNISYEGSKEIRDEEMNIEMNEKFNKDSSIEECNLNNSNIRRSDRIKTITQTKLQSSGVGLVKDKLRWQLTDEDGKIVQCDDRYNQLNAELEAENARFLKEMEESLNCFRIIRENEYRCERIISKEAERMICDCFLTREEEERGELGCGEDCLNRLLMIECGPDCTVRDRCTNRRFQCIQNAPCKVFKTEKKGFGLMADSEIRPGQFIMEYVGEVLNTRQFERRANIYSEGNNKHYYFMALRSDAIIDATQKGNISRFINHSCDPNAETQKWTVNGELRIGFFSTRQILPGEEITFDYQFQRYGREAQKCFCESEHCRGWIGEEPDSDEEYEEEEVSESEEEGVEKPSIAERIREMEEEEERMMKEAGIEVKPSKEAETVDIKKSLVQKPVKVRKRRVKKVKAKTDFGLRDAFADLDLEKDIASLMRTGLKNQLHTLCLNRLMVRAKSLDSRIRLLEILRRGEAPCRRLFLDYHGLRLLHGWMSEIDPNDAQHVMEFRHQLVETLEILPIPNKTMLKDSKVFQIVQSWADEKSSSSIDEALPTQESPKDNNSGSSPDLSSSKTDIKSSPIMEDEKKTSPYESIDNNRKTSLHDEIIKIAKKLLTAWENLPEVFRIPKRERIEQMKEHEREADRQYKALNLGAIDEDNERLERRRNKERFGVKRKYKRSRDSPDSDRKKSRHHHHHHSSSSRHHHHGHRHDSKSVSGKNSSDKSSNLDSNLSKEQRRQLFEAKVAKDEAAKRLYEERREFEIKCKFYGLDPKKVLPHDLPFCFDPGTGQWYTRDRRPVMAPPSHVQFQIPPQQPNPNEYKVPQVDLPPFWKSAVDRNGRMYYYHIKIRIPQWDPPIRILPLNKEQPQACTSKIGNVPQGATVENVSGVTKVEATVPETTAITEMDADDELDSDSSSDSSSNSDNDETGDSKEKKTKKLIEKKLNEKQKRHNYLVQERSISPRREEDRLYNQIEIRKYKENKEKIRRRKEEIKRRKAEMMKKRLEEGSGVKPVETTPVNSSSTVIQKDGLPLPIQDYLISSDEEDKEDDSVVNNPLIEKFVKGDKIVDELDALTKEKPLKRPLPIFEKDEHKKRSKLDDKKLPEDVMKSVIYGSGQKSSSSSKKRKDTDSTQTKSPSISPEAPINTTPLISSSPSSSSVIPTTSSSSSLLSSKSIHKLKSNQSRKAREKFRTDIAGIIVHHLHPYRKSSCKIGKITSDEDFKHLARKLTHFVMVKELKHCDSTGQNLIVTESVKNKSREFIKKYMAKYGEIYIRPDNDPEFKDIPH